MWYKFINKKYKINDNNNAQLKSYLEYKKVILLIL